MFFCCFFFLGMGDWTMLNIYEVDGHTKMFQFTYTCIYVGRNTVEYMNKKTFMIVNWIVLLAKIMKKNQEIKSSKSSPTTFKHVMRNKTSLPNMVYKNYPRITRAKLSMIWYTKINHAIIFMFFIQCSDHVVFLGLFYSANRDVCSDWKEILRRNSKNYNNNNLPRF